MLNKLKKLQENAYVPYSKFRVASIVIDEKGNEHTGVNIENASYPVTVCAERVALFKTISEGAKPKEIHLLTDSKSIGTPCGICRQAMSELMPLDAKVTLWALDGQSKEMTVEELLPFSFSSEDL